MYSNTVLPFEIKSFEKLLSYSKRIQGIFLEEWIFEPAYLDYVQIESYRRYHTLPTIYAQKHRFFWNQTIIYKD